MVMVEVGVNGMVVAAVVVVGRKKKRREDERFKSKAEVQQEAGGTIQENSPFSVFFKYEKNIPKCVRVYFKQ